MPLLPALEGEPCCTEIDAGDRLGLRRWKRFETGPKFNLSLYVRLFVERLGHQLETFDSLDGRLLVPYQCVIQRKAWETVRKSFNKVYPLQKTAYRHANGGSGAPGVHEDVSPRFVPAAALDVESMLEEQLAAAQGPKLVVRKTFLDLQAGYGGLQRGRGWRHNLGNALASLGQGKAVPGRLGYPLQFPVQPLKPQELKRGVLSDFCWAGAAQPQMFCETCCVEAGGSTEVGVDERASPTDIIESHPGNYVYDVKLRCKAEQLDEAFDRANPEMVIVANTQAHVVAEWNDANPLSRQIGMYDRITKVDGEMLQGGKEIMKKLAAKVSSGVSVTMQRPQERTIVVDRTACLGEST
eukprot:Skav232150  [mRNA]  locus=scaffold1040:215287:236408:- [translate_table: standard]